YVCVRRSAIHRNGPTRGLLPHHPSAVVRGCLDGDLFPGEDRLQCLLSGATALLLKLAAVAEDAVAVDNHRRRGPLDPEEVCRVPARIEDDGECQPVLLGEGGHILGRLTGVGVQGDHGGLALIILAQFGEQVLHISAAVASRAPERKNNNALLGPAFVLLQLAEFNALAVEDSYRKVRHFVADLDLRCDLLVVTLAVLVILVLTPLVAALLVVVVLGVLSSLVTVLVVVVVQARFFPFVAVRLGFGRFGVLVGFLRLLVAGSGFGGCGRLLL